jgi:arylsulfatase
MNERLRIPLVLASAVVGTTLVLTPARAQQTPRPNILVIFGDDIGQSNISAYTHGLVGYKTRTSTALAARA